MSSTHDDYSDLIDPAPGSARPSGVLVPLQGSGMRLQAWPAYWRLIWKEYRSQRGFWLGMVALVLFGQLVVLMFPTSTVPNLAMLFRLALIGTAFYGLGCAATLYSAEREADTLDRLRLLAISPGMVLGGKVVFALVSTAGLLLMTWLTAVMFSAGASADQLTLTVARDELGLLTLELMVWGLFFSALTKRPLNAVCLAAAAAILAPRLLVMAGSPGFSRPAAGISFLALGMTSWGRLTLIALVAVVDVWLLLRRVWTTDRGAVAYLTGLRAKRARQAGISRNSSWRMAASTASKSPRPLRRLLWQEWRQAWKAIIIFGAVGLVLVGYGALCQSSSWGLAALLPCLMGASVFHGEKEGGRFRFLANRGIAPREVWLAKQLVWLSATILLVPLSLIGLLSALRTFCGAFQIDPTLLGTKALWILVGYSCGQLASLLLARGLMAGFVSVLLAAVLGVWMVVVGLCELPMSLFVLPVPLAMLIATRIRVSDWLIERAGWRGWCLPTLVVAGSMLVVLVAFMAYRVVEVPRWDPLPAVAAFQQPPTAGDRQTAALYRAAGNALQEKAIPGEYYSPSAPTPHGSEVPATVRRWHATNCQAIPLALQATRSEQGVLNTLGDWPMGSQLPGELTMRSLACLLLVDGQMLECANELAGALGRYRAVLRMARHLASKGHCSHLQLACWVEAEACQALRHWAGHPKQTSQQLREGMEAVDVAFRDPLPITDAVVVDLTMLRRLLTREEGTLAALRCVRRQQPVSAALAGLWLLLPSERVRAQRVLSFATNIAQLQMTNLRERVSGDKPSRLARGYLSSEWCSHWPLDHWLKTTWPTRISPLVHPLVARVVPFDSGSCYAATQWCDDMLQRIDHVEMRRRATRLTLALVVYRSERGTLPESLEELVGEYLPEVPCDVLTGGAFGYRPRGFRMPVTFSFPQEVVAAPRLPVLYSTGSPDVHLGLVADANEMSYQLLDRHGHRFEKDIYGRQVWCFPIPGPDDGKK